MAKNVILQSHKKNLMVPRRSLLLCMIPVSSRLSFFFEKHLGCAPSQQPEFLGRPAWSQALGSMILVGAHQLGIFYRSSIYDAIFLIICP